MTTSNLQRLGVGIASALGLFVVVGLTAAMQQPVFPTGATGTGLFMAAAALADGTSNPTTTGIASFNMCFNGTTWDRCKSATLGNGANANAQLVTIANDSTGQIKATNLPTTVDTGNGATSASTVRVTLSNDSTGLVKTSNLPTTVTLNTGAADSSTLRVAPDPFMGGSTAKGVSGAITTTTSTQVVAAVASNYLYITNCTITQSSTTVGTAVNLQDGSGGTTIYTLPAPAAANSVGVSGGTFAFPVPLKVTTLGNGLFAAAVTTGSNFVVACQGFSSTVSR